MSGFEILIAAESSLEKDQEIIKTGLLYGDRVRLYDWTTLLNYSIVSTATEMMIESFSEMQNEVKRQVALEHGRIEDSERWAELTEIQNRYEKLVVKNGNFFQLNAAFEQNLIEVAAVSTDFFRVLVTNPDHKQSEELSRRIIEWFSDGMIDDILTGKFYPMTDQLFNEYIHDYFEEEQGLSETRKEQIKHVAAVHNALAMLPNFERASIEEIVDIRKEINPYLAKFRSAMLQYSADIKSMPWDKDFEGEISLLFHKEIAPTVEEVRSIVEQSSALRKFCTNVLNDKAAVTSLTATGSFIGASILPTVEMAGLSPFLLSAVAADGVMLAKNALNTYKEYIEEQKKAEQNSLYFYYVAGKHMKK